MYQVRRCVHHNKSGKFEVQSTFMILILGAARTNMACIRTVLWYFFFFTDMQASNGRPLGYNYKMFPSNRADNGVIYSIPFTKTRSDTLIRISLVTSFRAYKWALWRVLIDGQPCKSPRNIQSAQHQSDRGDTVTPGTVAGVCKATRRGRIGKGKHTIAITIINKVRDDLITGWHGSSMLEAQEIVMP